MPKWAREGSKFSLEKTMKNVGPAPTPVPGLWDGPTIRNPRAFEELIRGSTVDPYEQSSN